MRSAHSVFEKNDYAILALLDEALTEGSYSWVKRCSPSCRSLETHRKRRVRHNGDDKDPI